MAKEKRYRRDIQVLRGLAVLAVVLFHAKESYFPLGYLGVDVFFVISGFVVTPLILRVFTDEARAGGWASNLRYFYIRRFYRLAPALAVVLTVSAVTIFLLGPIGDHQRFAGQGIATLFLVGNVGADRYSGDYFSPNPNPLVHTWSLSVEEQIYVFLPLFLMLILRNRRSFKKITIVILGVVSALSFVSFLFPTILEPLYSRAGIELASQFSFYSPIDRVWQFTLGGLTFVLSDSYQKLAWKIPKVMHLAVVMSVVMILFSPTHLDLKVSSILASLFSVVILLSKSLDIFPAYLIKTFEWVGDRSYSIYLVHMPLLYLAKYSPVTQIGTTENRIIQSIIAVVASIVLGALSYSKVENRFRGKTRELNGLKTVTVAVILTFVSPLALFIAMDKGPEQHYWGLEKKIQVPAYAGEVDPNCNRDSEFGPPCTYTIEGATKTVLLIGDSHAVHISQAVVDAAHSTNWNAVVWAPNRCNIQFQQNISKTVSDICIENNKSMKRWVKANQPHAIIVSQFVYSYSSQNDLRDALLTLRSIVPNLLLIENSPVFPDEKDFMKSRPIIMPAYKPPKEFKQSLMQFKDKESSNQLANWARINGISTMNFDSIFCDGETCKRWSNGVWLYMDDDHFSVAGAKLTIPQLSAFLKRS